MFFISLLGWCASTTEPTCPIGKPWDADVHFYVSIKPKIAILMIKFNVTVTSAEAFASCFFALVKGLGLPSVAPLNNGATRIRIEYPTSSGVTKEKLEKALTHEQNGACFTSIVC